MELEDRVKALEGEMKILKNEIQGMLLEIQEQVLSHYYPSLRAMESPPPDKVAQPLQPMQTIPPDDWIIEEEPEETAALPKTKKVSLADIRATQDAVPGSVVEEQAPFQFEEEIGQTTMELAEPVSDRAEEKETAVSPEEEAPPLSEEETDPDTIMELAGWLSETVEKIGGERTSKLIEGYAEEGRLAPDVRDILTGLISFGDDKTTPEKVGMTEMLDVLLQLNKILNLRSPSDITMALSLIEEEKRG